MTKTPIPLHGADYDVSMVEKVAAAIFELTSDGVPFIGDGAGPHNDAAFKAARAAIAAMREPTAGMKCASADATTFEIRSSKDSERDWISDFEAAEGCRAAIDAALTEEPR